MEGLLKDLRYSARTILKNPSFTIVAVVTLALGIGANTTIFSVVNAVLLTHLPYPESERLVLVTKSMSGATVGSADGEFALWRERNQVFEQMTAAARKEFDFAGGDEPERVAGLRVYASFFDLLGIKLSRGRGILDEEQQPGGDRVVVISNGLWQRQFGSDEGIVGKSVQLDGESYAVIGVLAEGFEYPFGDQRLPDVIVPLVSDSRNGYYLSVIGRLNSGATLAQAQSDVAAIFEGMESRASNYGVLVIPLQEHLVKQARLTLLILSGAVTFVLLICCVNVANLLLARAEARRKEIAIRVAVGASRWRILRQLMTESLLLSTMGGALGLLLALWGKDLLVGVIGDWMPRAQQTSLDIQVLVFTAGISMLAGVIFGLAPAFAASQLNLTEALKEGSWNRTDSTRRNRLRSLLVISEVALALVLLIGASLLIKSLSRLHGIKLGFDTRNVLTMRLSLPRAKYATGQPINQFFEQVIERVRSVPGVESVGLVDTLPLTDEDATSRFVADEKSSEIQASGRSVSEGYFRSMGILIRAGRDFGTQDGTSAKPTAIINEEMAASLWPDDQPIGKRLRPAGTTRSIEIVGVAANSRNALLGQQQPEIYLPFARSPRRTSFLTVRTSTDPRNLIAAIRKEVLMVDKQQPIYNVKTMGQRLSDATRLQQFPMMLLSFFALLALVLAAAGIYGVISYLVEQRTHEIGIRLALGAQRTDILKLVIGRAVILTTAGVIAGLGGAWALTRVMSNLLFDVSATDVSTYAVISIFLTAVALAGCFVPARRATTVDPIVALRYE